MKQRDRKKEHKNYLPALLLTIIFWLSWVGIFLFVDPAILADFPIRGSYFIFFFVGFLAVWFLLSLLLADTANGLTIALGLVLLGYLRLFKLANILNLFLLIALVVGVLFYRKSNQIKESTTAKKEEE